MLDLNYVDVDFCLEKRAEPTWRIIRYIYFKYFSKDILILVKRFKVDSAEREKFKGN